MSYGYALTVHDVVPLRALRLVHGQRIAVGHALGLLEVLPGKLVLPPDEEVRVHLHLDAPIALGIVRLDHHAHHGGIGLAHLLDPEEATVEDALGVIVAQADQALARLGIAAEAEQVADAVIVGDAGVVLADQDLLGLEDEGAHDRLVGAAAQDAAGAVVAGLELAALAHIHRQDRKS